MNIGRIVEIKLKEKERKERSKQLLIIYDTFEVSLNFLQESTIYVSFEPVFFFNPIILVQSSKDLEIKKELVREDDVVKGMNVSIFSSSPRMTTLEIPYAVIGEGFIK